MKELFILVCQYFVDKFQQLSLPDNPNCYKEMQKKGEILCR